MGKKHVLDQNDFTVLAYLYQSVILYQQYNKNLIIELRHDKTNIVRLQPAWIQTSLRVRAVWSGSMLFAISFSTCNRVGKPTAWTLIRLRRLVWIHAGRKRTMLVLPWRGSYEQFYREFTSHRSMSQNLTILCMLSLILHTLNNTFNNYTNDKQKIYKESKNSSFSLKFENYQVKVNITTFFSASRIPESQTSRTITFINIIKGKGYM
jgi:hypothetical protein